MHYHGQMALQIALLVAFTQLIPEHQVQFFGAIKARVKVISYAISVLDINTHSEPTNGIPHVVYCSLHCRLSMSLGLDSIRVVR